MSYSDDTIMSYLDGMLNHEQAQLLEKELRSNIELRNRMDQYRKLNSLLQQSVLRSPSTKMKESILQAIDSTRQPMPKAYLNLLFRNAQSSSVLLLVGIATLAVLSIVVWWVFERELSSLFMAIVLSTLCTGFTLILWEQYTLYREIRSGIRSMGFAST